MNVKDVMTSPVLSVESDSPIMQAIRIMLQRHISGLPRRNRNAAAPTALARIPHRAGTAC